MDRRLSPETLIEYHFGILEGVARTAVEEALLQSEVSLRAYLRLKRELDGAYASDEVPSPTAKARLRASVQREVSGAQMRREAVAEPAHRVGRAGGQLRRWGRGIRRVFWRPIPLYQTLAVAAVAAVLVGFFGLGQPAGDGSEELLPRAGTTPAPKVDFAGPRPLGLDVL
jgi:hypothetical protein